MVYLSRKLLFACGLFFVMFCCLPPPSYATEYFTDNFDTDMSKWDYVGGVNNGVNIWRIEGGNLISEVNRYSYSYLYARNTYLLDDYVFEADVMNLMGVDQHFLFRVAPDKSSFYQLEIRYGDPFWPQDGNSLRLWRFRGGSYSLVLPDISHVFTQNVWYKLKVVLVGEKIKVYVNNDLLLDVSDDPVLAILSGGIGLNSYAGDYFYRNVVNKYDNINVYSDTPTPTRKIVVIPGLGASWNERAMVFGETVNDDEWRMTPFVTNYDSLVEALEDQGKEKGEDFWVWNYDWRRPVAEIQTRLNSFIESKVGVDEKVDLVGHSLGGLVARTWGQDNISNSRLGKIISLGSPHYGVVKAYDVWNGAKISEGIDLGSLALNVLIELQKKNFPSRLEAVRNMAPVIKDLLPTFDFAKKNGIVLAPADINQKNDYLVAKNLTVSPVFDYFRAVLGTGRNTKEWINLGERNVFDRVLGWWPEGRPVSYEYGDGDVTVLKKSANFSADIGGFDELVSDHGLLVDRAIPNIFDELGLGVGVGGTGDGNFDDHLVFYLGSPAKMGVSCDGGVEVNDSLGFVILKNANYDQCRIVITGTENGTYHLVLGNTSDEGSWKYFEDNIGAGVTKTLTVDGRKVDLTADEGNLDYLYGLIIRDANYLLVNYPGDINLTGVLTAVAAKSDIGVADKIFAFRKARKESVVSERMLEVLKSVLAINRKNTTLATASNLLIKIIRLKDLVDYNTKIYVRRLMVPSRFGSLNHDYLNRLTDEAKAKKINGEYGGVAANEILVSRLYLQIW